MSSSRIPKGIWTFQVTVNLSENTKIENCIIANVKIENCIIATINFKPKNSIYNYSSLFKLGGGLVNTLVLIKSKIIVLNVLAIISDQII